MNIKDLKAYLNIPRDATYRLVNDPSFFPARKIGKCWNIDTNKLKAWIELQLEACRKEEIQNGKENRG